MFQKVYSGEKEVMGFLTRVCNLPSSIARNVYNKTFRYSHTEQFTPPAKGAFIQYSVEENISASLAIKNKILKLCSQNAARNPSFKPLYIFEKFQTTQKGPVQKVTPKSFLEAIDKITENSKKDIMTDEGKSLLIKASRLLQQQLVASNLMNVILARDIHPTLAWLSMHHAASRGAPWLLKGNRVIDWNGKEITVDEAITKLYGDDMFAVVDMLTTMKAVVGMIGLRFQGQPVPDPAKVRIIYMPEVPEQYALRAVQVPIQKAIKDSGDQLGYAWATPDVYWKNMAKAMEGQNTKYYYVSLDYSKFDSRCSYFTRNLAIDVLFGIMLSDSLPWKQKFIDKIKELWVEQYMVAPNAHGSVSAYQVSNLLSSGDVVTQLLGNVINRLYQFAIAIALGYDLPFTLGACLGDDTLLPIPVKIVRAIGSYKKLLVKLESIVELFGGKLNIDKQYPEISSSIFLQRLYNYPLGIEGEYSLIRTIDSLVWAENPRVKVEGVNNLDALETIGQLSVANLVTQSRGKVTNKELLLTEIIPWWLTRDNALRALIGDCLAKTHGNVVSAGAYMFAYLVAACGGKSAVREGLGIDAFDKYQLSSALRSADALATTLPILSWMCEAGKNMPRKSWDYGKVYGLKSVVTADYLSQFYSSR